MTAPSHDSPLTQGAVLPHLLKLCIPPICAMLAVFSYYLVDAYFIAKLGLEPLTAFSFASPICFSFITIGVAFGIGLTSVIANHVGKYGMSKSKFMVRDGYLLALIMAGLFLILGQSTIRPLFSLIGAQGAILDYVEIYMEIWYLALFFIFLQICGSNIIRSTTGQSLLPAISTLLSAVINIILDPILIFGWWKFPELGMAGSAYATLIASMFTFAFTFGIVLYKRLIIWKLPNIRLLLQNHWLPILPVFIFATVENISPSLGEVFSISLASDYGNEKIAALGIIGRFFLILLTPYIGIFIGLTPFIGQNWGAKQYGRAKQAFIFAGKICLIYWAITTLMMFFLSGVFARQFSDVPEIIAWVEFFYHYVYFSVLGFALLNLASAVFYGIQKASAPCILQIMGLLIYIASVLILKSYLGFRGILLAEIISLLSVGVAAIVWLYRIGFFGKH